MTHVFLDFGANCFQGLRYFGQLLNMGRDWRCIAYEANPYVYRRALQQVELVQSELGIDSLDLYPHAVAAWNGATEISCILGELDASGQLTLLDDFGGSSIIQRNDERFKRKLASRVEVVRCIDVNDIISRIATRCPSAQIHIKCDIEGAEYDVIPRLLQSQHLGMVKRLYIEWHPRYWPEKKEMMRQRSQDLMSSLRCRGVQVLSHW